MRRLITLCVMVVALCCMSQVQAKEVSPARTTDGKEVTRLLIDREKVTVVYADGSKGVVEDKIVVKNSRSSAVETIKTDESLNVTKADGIYDLQGRRVREANLMPGVYVKVSGGKSSKFIKK